MIQDMVVNLSLGDKPDPVMDYAISVATSFQSHVSAIAIEYELVAIWVAFEGGIATQLMDEQRRENKRVAREAKARFDEAARRAGLHSESRVVRSPLDMAGDYIGKVARVSDLALVGQPEADGVLSAGSAVIESVLFGAGRPVIVVPRGQERGLALDHVTVCWDGSRAAARAVADALPFLRKSKVIELLIVEEGRAHDEKMPGADMAAHLARHGLNVELNRMSAADADVPKTILSRIANTSSDFVVMGGYGHSRLREFILGGVTRATLSEIGVPVLMSH